MESRNPGRNRRFLPAWVLIWTVATTFWLVTGWEAPAMAGNTEGQNTTTASVRVSGGTIAVRAGHRFWTPPVNPAGLTAKLVGPDPNQPYGCTYYVLGDQSQQLLGTGGEGPGYWVAPTCAGPGVINPMPAIWVSQLKTPVPPVPPAVLAQQALTQLALPSPAVEMAPPAGAQQLVNLATWLWVSPSAWRSYSATAAAGPVSATATATPVKVVWDMGDGGSVTCNGPGTPYDSAEPDATTDCSYTWAQSSAGQPSGAYQVTATVYFEVTWQAVGAAGGGDLGLVAGPAVHLSVPVAESEALNNSPGA